MWCRQQDGDHGSRNPHRKCVITYLPNHIASKTDGAQAAIYIYIVKNYINYTRDLTISILNIFYILISRREYE